MAFPENPPAEWFAVDLLEHADQAATSHVEVADVRALRELRPVPEGAVDPRLHDAINLLDEFRDNRAKSVRCVHPLVTLPEKLDALHRGFPNDKVVPAAFVRHYDDAAQLIRNAHETIDSMYWGPRLSVEDATATIRAWITAELA